jgi:hypothetical protein
MNIQELDSYNLADAVKFNDRLNPRLWGKDEHLKPQVRKRLLEIAQDFREFLGIKDLDLRDITISGSNAAYTYTPNSDIDLHLVVDMPEDEVYRELFDAKKFQYNEMHNIKIGGYDVELYVQDAEQPHISQGIYSIANNAWVQVPRRVKANVDDLSTQNKFETVGHQIEKAIASGSLKSMTRMAEKIKKMRQTGLEQHGEFGPENLAFKMLRSQGKIKELYDARNAAKDRKLSLKEQPKKPFTYGFAEDAGMTWDGVDPTTCMFLNEEDPVSDEDILKDFIEFCVKELNIKQMPTVKLRKDPQWSVVNRTFGRYIDEKHLLEVAFGQRHIMDVLRTVAHELTHKHQHEREDVPADAGETGSQFENEANARAGVLMRDYGQLHPELFNSGATDDLEEGWKSKLAGAALAGAAALGSPSAQADTNPIGIARDVGTAVRTAQHMTRAGIQDELSQELRNFIRAQGGDPGSQNQSTLYQWQKRYDQSRKNSQARVEPQPLPASDDPKANYYNKPEPLLPDIKNESASGYIPTKKQARDPRWSMALTQDIRPGQLGKEANKLNLKTDKQGVPQVANPNGLFEKLALELSQFKKKNKLEESTEVLDEVKMSPTALQRWAKSPEAQGIRAGFEAELIFRDTNSGDDSDYDMEPDYDMDERCRSIQQIIDFFNNGEYGGMTQRQEARLQEGLDEQYYEWYDEQMIKDFTDEAEDLIRKVLVDEGDWDLDNEIQKQLALLDLTDDEMNDIIKAGERAPKFTSTKEQQTYAEENPFYDQYLDAQNEAEGLLDDLVADEVRKQGANWDAALDDFRDNYSLDDDSGFFDDAGLRWMSDVANNYDLDWPYMTGGGGNGGSREWDEIGDSLHSAIDMPVKVSSNYHSTTRKEGLWIVEPDTSLQPDDSEDFGLEIVSPPLPLEQALEKLQAVTDWANSPEGNAYTNSSTGLHMGVSVPFKGGDVDYLKLILFLGDEYVLQSFGREANTYTKSAMSKFRENIRGGRADPMGAIKLMQHGLLELAYKEIQKGVGEGKYTSAHIQKGYIEFRSAGGDWLAEENADPEKLSSTMLRYARAMSIAANASEERREYAKKLYKLVAPEGDSQLALFSQYAAGELTAEQLKKRWAEKTIGTEKKMNQRFRLYQNVGGVWEPVPGAEWNGYPEDEVKMRVWAKYGREALDTGEYQLVNMGEQDWEVYDVKTGATLEIVKGKSKGEVADAVYDKYVDQGIGFQVRPYVDPATMTPRAKLAKRITTKKQEPEQLAQATNERGVPYWEIFERETGHVVHTFLADTQADAWEDTKNWLAGMNAEQPNLFSMRAKMKNAQVKDVEPDVAQNFNQPTGDMSAFERNSDRIDAIRQNATDRVGSWAIYDVTLGREISRMDDVPWQQASDRADELERSTGHNMSVRGLSEAVDAVSGTGAIARAIAGARPPSPVPVRRKDPAVKLDIKNRPLDPYAQTYKKPVEENFADGRNPQDKGDSVRHGIPKGATMAQLEKAAKASGRKGQLARWQINMRRGKAK